MQKHWFWRGAVSRILILLSILLLCTSFLIGCKQNKAKGEGFYVYSEKDITQFLSRKGYKEIVISAVMRSSDGTKLRIYNDSEERVFLVACDGSIKAVKVPGLSWFNDEDQVIAWLDYSKNKVLYRNGYIDKPPFWFRMVDQAGKYFAKDDRSKITGQVLPRPGYGLEIYSIDKPDAPMITIEKMNREMVQ